MESYLETSLPEELCIHMFRSFQKSSRKPAPGKFVECYFKVSYGLINQTGNSLLLLLQDQPPLT